MGIRVRGELARARCEAVAGPEVREEGRILDHLLERAAVALAVRGNQEVETLAVRRQHGLADDRRRPREPGDEQHRGRGRRGRDVPHAVGPLDQRGQQHERQREDEDRARERQRRDQCARRRPPGGLSLLPGPGVRVGGGDDDQPGESLAEHQRDVVLRPRVGRVEQGREQAEPLVAPAPRGQRQQEDASAEEERLSPEREVLRQPVLTAAEEGEVGGISGRPEGLVLGCLPGRAVELEAGDVVEALRVDVVEAGLERGRVAPVEDRPGGGDVRGAVGRGVELDARDVDEAVHHAERGQEQRGTSEPGHAERAHGD